MTMNLSRRAMIATTLAFAATPILAMEPMWFAEDGVAIRGYDPVAYFDEKGPVKGSSEFQTTFEDGVFQFASAENKALFDADPARYAPQFGGYCAYAVSRGYTAPIDPEAWSIHDGKLYLNFSKSVRTLWAANKKGNIQAADENWPSVLSGS